MDDIKYKVGDKVTINQKISGTNSYGLDDIIIIQGAPTFTSSMERKLGKSGEIITIKNVERNGVIIIQARVQFSDWEEWWFHPDSFKQKDFTKRNLILSKINKKPIPQG